MQWINGRDKRWGKVLTRRADEQRNRAGAGAPPPELEVFDVTGTLPFVEAHANEAMQQRAFAAPGIFHGLVDVIDPDRVRKLDLTHPDSQQHVRGLATLADSFNNAAARNAGGQEFDVARGAYRHLFGPPRSRPQPQPQPPRHNQPPPDFANFAAAKPAMFHQYQQYRAGGGGAYGAAGAGGAPPGAGGGGFAAGAGGGGFAAGAGGGGFAAGAGGAPGAGGGGARNLREPEQTS
ncbi:hypothetical protein NFJ02_29g67110 [Pycnococcus provasolii]